MNTPIPAPCAPVSPLDFPLPTNALTELLAAAGEVLQLAHDGAFDASPGQSSAVCASLDRLEAASQQALSVAAPTREELAYELRHAHKLLSIALNCLPIDRKTAFAREVSISGFDGEGTTRANEREAVLAAMGTATPPRPAVLCDELRLAGKILHIAWRHFDDPTMISFSRSVLAVGLANHLSPQLALHDDAAVLTVANAATPLLLRNMTRMALLLAAQTATEAGRGQP